MRCLPLVPKNRQHGLSIVELMVAMTIALVLLTGILQIFISSRATYAAQESLSRVQESARFAMEFMKRDLRMAGNSGCGRRSNFSFSEIDPISGTVKEFGDGEGLYIQRAANTDFDPFDTVDLVTDNDTVVIRTTYMSSDSAPVDGQTEDTADFEISHNRPGLEKDQVAMIYDCRNGFGDIFTITDVQGNTDDFGMPSGGSVVNVAHGLSDNVDNRLRNEYSSTANVARVESRWFFVGRRNDDAPPSLYTRRTTGQTLELVGNVEAIYASVGLRADADDETVDRYLPAADVSADEWRDVVAIRLRVVSRGDEVMQEERNFVYPIPGDNNPPEVTDRRLRQVFSSTITLRNTLP